MLYTLFTVDECGGVTVKNTVAAIMSSNGTTGTSSNIGVGKYTLHLEEEAEKSDLHNLQVTLQ